MAHPQFAVEIKDKEFNRKYKRMMDKFPDAVDNAVRGATYYGERQYKRMTPRVTGQMRRGYKVRRVSIGIWKIINRVAHALSVDEGSKPHKILPKHGKFLYWTTSGKRRITMSGGKPSRKSKSGFDIYAKGVNHPGFEGHKISDKVKPMIVKRLKRLLIVNFGKIKRAFA